MQSAARPKKAISKKQTTINVIPRWALISEVLIALSLPPETLQCSTVHSLGARGTELVLVFDQLHRHSKRPWCCSPWAGAVASQGTDGMNSYVVSSVRRAGAAVAHAIHEHFKKADDGHGLPALTGGNGVFAVIPDRQSSQCLAGIGDTGGGLVLKNAGSRILTQPQVGRIANHAVNPLVRRPNHVAGLERNRIATVDDVRARAAHLIQA